MVTSVMRLGYLKLRNVIMERSGLQPKGIYSYSANHSAIGKTHSKRIPLPNLSGELRPVIRDYIERFGLGQNCLLVSENFDVKVTLNRFYADVKFCVTDFHTELMADDKGKTVDFVWDVCTQPPKEMQETRFDSIISQSLLEHVINPTQAIVNFLSLIRSGGCLYLSTHTPSFHYHPYPRDYVRFHHDYFFDLPSHIETISGIKCQLEELHSKEGVICVCYQRT